MMFAASAEPEAITAAAAMMSNGTGIRARRVFRSFEYVGTTTSFSPARHGCRVLRKRFAATANEGLTAQRHSTKRSPPDGSWNNVSCRPAGASSRELSEPHGVLVGSASTVAPASASVLVVSAASSTSSAMRM